MFRKKKQTLSYDKTKKKPVIRASICTGEKVAGFKNLETGKFEDVMLISNEKDLRYFLQLYEIGEQELGKEW